jgi:hypothetical protein
MAEGLEGRRNEMLKVRVISEPWYAGYKIGIFEIGNDGKKAIVKSIEFEEIIDGAVYPDSPPLHLNQESAQLLMNDLWFLGVKPSDGTGSTGQLEAVKYHLEDMRSLVFKIKEPK